MEQSVLSAPNASFIFVLAANSLCNELFQHDTWYGITKTSFLFFTPFRCILLFNSVLSFTFCYISFPYSAERLKINHLEAQAAPPAHDSSNNSPFFKNHNNIIRRENCERAYFYCNLSAHSVIMCIFSGEEVHPLPKSVGARTPMPQSDSIAYISIPPAFHVPQCNTTQIINF